MNYEELTIEGRNAVLEAFRSGKTIDKLFVQDGCQDGSINTIKREARKHDTIINFVTKERLDQMSATGHHQGVIAQAAAYDYGTVEEMLANAILKSLSAQPVCAGGAYELPENLSRGYEAETDRSENTSCCGGDCTCRG